MTDDGEYTRFVPLPVWPPTLGGMDPNQGVTTSGVPVAVYEHLRAGGDEHGPLTSPFATRAEELAAFHPEPAGSP